MKIMTFNTGHCFNELNKRIDYEAMANVIKDYDADIVGLNEIRDKGADAEYENQMKILSELTGIKNYFFAEAISFDGKNPYGNGFLSKIPVEIAETISIPDPEPKTGTDYYETRCLLKVKLENGLTVLVTHFGLNRDEQENAVKTVLENLEDEKCILMGDFNVKPSDEILIPFRNKMKDTADVFKEPMFSFPSDAPDRKIDYIFVSRDIEVTSAEIPPVLVSDHRPHTAIIKVP